MGVLAVLPVLMGTDVHAEEVRPGMIVTQGIDVFYPNATLAFTIDGRTYGSPLDVVYRNFSSAYRVDVGPDGRIVLIDGRPARDYDQQGRYVEPIVVLRPNGAFDFRFGSVDEIRAHLAVAPDGRIVTAILDQ